MKKIPYDPENGAIFLSGGVKHYFDREQIKKTVGEHGRSIP